MSHIFISYSHDDRAYARRLAKALEQQGFSIWIDDRIDYGTQWPDTIESYLDNCNAFILIMTLHSKNSKWVQNELHRAIRKNKKIFPLLLEGVEPWLSIEATQYVDVRGGKLPPQQFFYKLSQIVQPSPQKKKVGFRQFFARLFDNISFGQIRISPLVIIPSLPYKILKSDLEWEILTADGTKANFRKTVALEILEDGIQYLREYSWGDAYLLGEEPNIEDFNVNPGAITQIYREGSKFVFVISLDKKYNRGETLDLLFERKLSNSFTQNYEWVEFYPVTVTQNQRIKVVFPKDRPYKKAQAIHTHGDYSIKSELGENEFFSEKADGKICLIWNIDFPISRDSYSVEWDW